MNRETWLIKATELLSPVFLANTGNELPPVNVSIGFPSRGAVSRKNRSVGQCWARKQGTDGKNNIFISPVIDDPIRALGVLVHELCHAVDDCEHGHKKPFVTLARAMMLEGKPTATTEGDAFKRLVAPIMAECGEFPHRALEAGARIGKTQSTRMIKCTCPGCGYTVRTTRVWIETAIPRCPVDDSEMIV